MNALNNFSLGPKALSDTTNQTLFTSVVSAVQQTISSGAFVNLTSQITVDPTSPPTVGDMIHTAVLLEKQMVQQVRADILAGNTMTVDTINSIVQTALSNAASVFQGVYDQRTSGQTGTTTTPDGATLYANNCATCHGPLASSTKAGATAAQIQTGINTVSAMSSLSSLSSADIQAIADALATSGSGSTTGSGTTVSSSDCTSCHGMPPNGTSEPNIAGAHAVHVALPTVGTNCAVCHNNSTPDNGTVEVGILSIYNAKSATAQINPDGSPTCINVSCHGGQTTPNWETGSLDVNTQCTSCHSYGTTQYNSYYSGQHSTHVQEVGLSCTTCHDTTKLAANHFTHLDTPTMEGPASGTIKSSVGYNGSTCTNSCHGTRSWAGGND
jgi:predicted CxxxxCH...CXXCH cytochrome family protein